jgi:hypothetical protein
LLLISERGVLTGKQQQTAAAQAQSAWDKAMISCMQGRGYMLK